MEMVVVFPAHHEGVADGSAAAVAGWLVCLLCSDSVPYCCGRFHHV